MTLAKAVGASAILLLITLTGFVQQGLAAVNEVPGEPPASSTVDAVNSVLDDFHLAASEADEERYFGHLAPSGVFLGTDASERWTRDEFHEFVHPHFSRGQGWTYEPVERHVTLSVDGTAAWFDEHLENTSYGTCRGSGALQLIDGVWKIEQYNLTIPVPNELSKELVERIRALANEAEDSD